MILGIAVAVALIVLGRVAYGIPVPLAGLPALFLVLLLASAAFCCLGFAFTLAVGKAGAAVPLGTGVTLALYFLSGNFFILEERPLVLRVIGEAFPVKHLNDALLTPLNPNASGSRIEWLDLLGDRRLGPRRAVRRPALVPLDGRPRSGLTDGACQVWWATVAAPRPSLTALLSRDERAHAARLQVQSAQDAYVLARALARTVIGRALAVDPADVRFDHVCRHCGGAHGKPRVVNSDLEVSWAHSSERVVLALARDTPVGVDVETISTGTPGAELSRWRCPRTSAARLRRCLRLSRTLGSCAIGRARRPCSRPRGTDWPSPPRRSRSAGHGNHPSSRP